MKTINAIIVVDEEYRSGSKGLGNLSAVYPHSGKSEWIKSQWDALYDAKAYAKSQSKKSPSKFLSVIDATVTIDDAGNWLNWNYIDTRKKTPASYDNYSVKSVYRDGENEIGGHRLPLLEVDAMPDDELLVRFTTVDPTLHRKYEGAGGRIVPDDYTIKDYEVESWPNGLEDWENPKWDHLPFDRDKLPPNYYLLTDSEHAEIIAENPNWDNASKAIKADSVRNVVRKRFFTNNRFKQASIRSINGKRFIGSKAITTNKQYARKVAEVVRTRTNRNARVIPNSKGFRIYVGPNRRQL